MDTRSKLLFTQLKNFTADVCLVKRLLDVFYQSIALIDISAASFSFGFMKKNPHITIFGSFASHLVPFMIPKSHHNTEFDSEILSQLLFREDQSASS